MRAGGRPDNSPAPAACSGRGTPVRGGDLVVDNQMAAGFPRGLSERARHARMR
jgi:hypothetical protein